MRVHCSADLFGRKLPEVDFPAVTMQMPPSCWVWNWAARTVSLLHWDSSWRAERCQYITTINCSVQSSSEHRRLPLVRPNIGAVQSRQEMKENLSLEGSFPEVLMIYP